MSMQTLPVLATAAKASVTPAAERTNSSAVGSDLTRGSLANSLNSAAGNSCGGAYKMRGASPTARKMALLSAAGERSMTSTLATALIAAAVNCSTNGSCTIACCMMEHAAYTVSG